MTAKMNTLMQIVTAVLLHHHVLVYPRCWILYLQVLDFRRFGSQHQLLFRTTYRDDGRLSKTNYRRGMLVAFWVWIVCVCLQSVLYAVIVAPQLDRRNHYLKYFEHPHTLEMLIVMLLILPAAGAEEPLSSYVANFFKNRCFPLSCVFISD